MTNIKVQTLSQTGRHVSDGLFGTNTLYSVNTTMDGTIHSEYSDAVEFLGINSFRYPGGHAESTINLLTLENGEIRSEVRAFMEWVESRSSPSNPASVILTLPTKYDINLGDVYNFVQLVVAEYGDLILGFQIGNEYSIGPHNDAYIASNHPEENANSDYIPAMNETDYGIIANNIIESIQEALDDLANIDSRDIDIVIQGGDIAGRASDFKGNGTNFQANAEIISHLSTTSMEAIDAVVFHYYYNYTHPDGYAFQDIYQESRSLEDRAADFQYYFDRELITYVTEWNILQSNYEMLGLQSASVLLEQFQEMVEAGVTDAYIWPLQHRTTSNLAGTRSPDIVDLTILGATFGLLESNLRSTDSETGRRAEFYALDVGLTAPAPDIEINGFSDNYATVFFLSSRTTETSEVGVDLSYHAEDVLALSGRILEFDPASADGINDFADAQGQNRVGRRPIDELELDALRDLPFFDETNSDHLRVLDDGTLTTYLPHSAGFLPRVSNPQAIDDFYVFTEGDVAPEFTELTLDVDDLNAISFDLQPFEVATLMIENVHVQNGTEFGDQLLGGYGSDRILGGGDNDTLMGGEGNDTLKGGWGDDTLNGGRENDTLFSGFGIDTVDGGAGLDQLVIGAQSDEVTVEQNGVTLVISYDDNRIIVNNIEVFQFTDQLLGLEEVESMAGQSNENGPIRLFANAQMSRNGEMQSFLYGGAEPEELQGSEWNDHLFSGEGHDTIFSGARNDLISGGLGNDVINAGDGNDTVGGGPGDDFVLLGFGNDVAGLGEGNDILEGGSGDDTVSGGSGDDALIMDAGNDVAGGSFGADQMDGGTGNDDLGGGSGADNLFGGQGNDTIGGGLGADYVEGNGNDDMLFGGAGSDTIRGGSGSDHINAGAGSDVIFGGVDADTFVFVAGLSTSSDIIMDFEPGIDTLRLVGVDKYDIAEVVFEGFLGLQVAFAGEFIFLQDMTESQFQILDIEQI